MAFEPQDHLIQLRGKEYLEVCWRIVWFREKHPNGAIITELINVDPIVVKATIYDAEGHILSTGHAALIDKGNAVWSGRVIEKNETSAVGRALAMAGFGTQFSREEDDEDHLADSPVDRAKQNLGQGQNRRIPAPQAAAPASAPKNAPAPPAIVQKASLVARVQLEKGKGEGKFNYVLLNIANGFVTRLYEGRMLRELGYPVDDWKADSAQRAKRYDLSPMLQCEFQPDGSFVLSHLNPEGATQ